MAGVRRGVVFEDVIAERRSGSDLMWVSRAWEPTRAYVQPHKSSAVQIKTTVLHSPRLRQVVTEISQEEAVPTEELYKRVEEILNEVGYNRELSILRWLALLTAKILKKLCSAIYVNQQTLKQVKSELGNNPVLFVPSHRSYGDFILMSYVCFHYELDIPRIAAGMDFHAMVLMGRILRDSCAFFMRRSFNNDRLYTAIFSQYVQTLITDGDAAVEFFIEGTRSRTNKSLMPKFGFLSMALKPFLTGLVPDISVVPINLSYDRPLEEVLFAYEVLGIPKPKESTRGLVKALSILNENYGSVYIQFGKPFSVKQFFGRTLDRSLHTFGPVYLQDMTAGEARQVVDLAHAVVRHQQALTLLTCFNLVAGIINNNMAAGAQPLTLQNLVNEVTWLSSVFTSLGVHVQIEGDVAAAVAASLELHHRLVTLQDGVVKLCRVHTGVANCGRSKGHELSASTMDVAVPLVMVQHYVNPCACFLVNLCLLVLVLERLVPRLPASLDDLFTKFQLLRGLFAFEFVFHSSYDRQDFETTLEQCLRLNLVSVTESGYYLGDDIKLRRFLCNFFASFVPGYLVVAQVFIEAAEKKTTETEVFRTSQRIVEERIKAGTILHPANLSLDLLTNAIQALAQLQATSRTKSNGDITYEVDTARTRDINNILVSLDEALTSHADLSSQFSSFLNGKL